MLTNCGKFAYVDPFARGWPGFSTTDAGISPVRFYYIIEFPGFVTRIFRAVRSDRPSARFPDNRQKSAVSVSALPPFCLLLRLLLSFDPYPRQFSLISSRRNRRHRHAPGSALLHQCAAVLRRRTRRINIVNQQYAFSRKDLSSRRRNAESTLEIFSSVFRTEFIHRHRISNPQQTVPPEILS